MSRKQNIDKTLAEFSNFVEEDLKFREQTIITLVEKGDAPLGSVSNEQSFAKIVKTTLKEYVLKFLNKEDT